MQIEQIKNLLSIVTPADITSFVVNDIYEDDHLQCVDVVINGTPLEFLWYDNVGFINYWNESKKAMNELVGAIHAAVQMKLDEVAQSEWTDAHAEQARRIRTYFEGDR
jgi:hypothetical protein